MLIVKPNQVIQRVCIEIAKNYAMKVPAIRRFRTKLGRTAGDPVKENLHRYVFDLVDKILRHTGDIKGKTILEVGPGDHFATGLAMIALVAKSYSVLDRFPGDYKGEVAMNWYRLLQDNWKYSNWPKNLDVNNWFSSENITIYNKSVEDFHTNHKFDIVCSYAVGEHITDIKSFVNLNKKCIIKKGVGLHCIDFGGHQWDSYGDPFLFMKFPDFVWNLMGSARGEPNRVRLAPYLRYFEEAGLKVETMDKKFFNFNKNDCWVTDRMDESFSVQEATVLLKHVL
jgi:hypothetical protein